MHLINFETQIPTRTWAGTQQWNANYNNYCWKVFKISPFKEAEHYGVLLLPYDKCWIRIIIYLKSFWKHWPTLYQVDYYKQHNIQSQMYIHQHYTDRKTYMYNLSRHDILMSMSTHQNSKVSLCSTTDHVRNKALVSWCIQ